MKKFLRFLAKVFKEPINEVSMHNLFRVQCMSPAILKGGVKMGSEPLTIYKGLDAVTLTPFGLNFIKAAII